MKNSIISAIVLILIIALGIINNEKLNFKNTTSACNPHSHTIQIIDEAVTKRKITVKEVNDRHFRSFITSVTEGVLAKLAGERPCSDKPTIELVFVRFPLVTSGNEPLARVPEWDAPQSDLTCRLDSPWIKLALRRSSNPLVRAVFIWNERQFLVDQVLLRSQDRSLTVRPVPFTRDLFEQYANSYAESEILRLPPPDGKPIEERIPVDVLWLFRQSPQSTRGPFSGIARWSGMTSILDRATGGYINLTLALFEQCFASNNSEISYESILEVRDIIPLEEYQIEQLKKL